MPTNKFFTLRGDYALASFILGLASILLFFPLLLLPFVDGIIALLAVILGCYSLRGSRRGLAVSGIILGSLVLLYGIVLIVQALIYL